MKRSRKTPLGVLFLLYGILMLWLLFGQRIGRLTVWDYREQLLLNLNLIPFATIGRYLRFLQTQQGDLLRHAIINLAGNIVMFVPLGFFLPCSFPKLRTFLRLLPAAAGMILAVEVIQLFTLMGSCDIDDLLLNLIGIFIGYLGFYLLRHRLSAE